MSNKKVFLILFSLALLMRIAALLSFSGEKSLLYVSDSLTYIQVAKNIINHGVYSMEISETPHPDNFRTPLYPLFLLPFVALKTSLYFPAVVQVIIMSFAAGMFFLLGQKIFDRRVAMIAAFLFAGEPFGALISAQIMTEAIFTTIFITALLFLAIYVRQQQNKPLFVGIILLGLSALARPISFYLFLLIPLAILLAETNLKIVWRKIPLALLIFFLILSPWLIFVKLKLNTYNISSVNDLQLYAYHGKYFDQWRQEHGAPPDDRLPILDLHTVNDTLNARAIPPLKYAGIKYIKDHFLEYIIYHISRMPNLFTDSGYANILNGITFFHSNHSSPTGGFFDQLKIEWPNAIFAQIKEQPVFLLLFLADLFFIAIATLAFAKLLLEYKLTGKINKETIFFVSVLIFYSFLSSPIGGARLRIPINPLLFVLAIDSLYIIFKKVGLPKED